LLVVINTCLLPLRSDLTMFALTRNIQYHTHSPRYAIRFGWLHESCNQVQEYLIAKNRLCMLEILFQQPPAFLCTSIMFISLRYSYYNTRCITPHLHIHHAFPIPGMYTQETFQMTVCSVGLCIGLDARSGRRGMSGRSRRTWLTSHYSVPVCRKILPVFPCKYGGR
jgi:hypothetical protein